MARRKKKLHRQVPGAIPGTLAASPDARSSSADYFLYSGESLDEGKFVGTVSPAEGEVLWVDMEGLADVECIQKIGAQFQLHRLALEDIFYTQRAKAEFQDSYLLLCFPQLCAGGELEQVALFLGQSFVLTFQEGTPGDSLDSVRMRLREARGAIRDRGPDYLAYSILDAVIDAYFPVVDQWGQRLLELEENILDGATGESLSEIRAIRRSAARFSRVLRPFRDGLTSIVHHESELLAAKTLPYFRDCHDHIVELLDLLAGQRELTAELLEVHQANINQRTNDAMQTLTVIATIFIPLSFVAGLYGMNFDPAVSPWNMPELHWKYGYPAVLTFMTGVAVAFVFYFRRKGWLGKGSE